MHGGMQGLAHSQRHPSAELGLFDFGERECFAFLGEHLLKPTHSFNRTRVRVRVCITERDYILEFCDPSLIHLLVVTNHKTNRNAVFTGFSHLIPFR